MTSRPVMAWLVAAYLVLMFTAMIQVTQRPHQSMRHLAGSAVSSVGLFRRTGCFAGQTVSPVGLGNFTTLRLDVVELQQSIEKLLADRAIHEVIVESLDADTLDPRSAGFDTAAHIDYRGAAVVGAWQWLPGFNVGLAMEIDEAEAFGLVRMLRRVIGVMFR